MAIGPVVLTQHRRDQIKALADKLEATIDKQMQAEHPFYVVDPGGKRTGEIGTAVNVGWGVHDDVIVEIRERYLAAGWKLVEYNSWDNAGHNGDSGGTISFRGPGTAR